MIEKTTQSVANLVYHAHIYYDPKKDARRRRASVRCD